MKREQWECPTPVTVCRSASPAHTTERNSGLSCLHELAGSLHVQQVHSRTIRVCHAAAVMRDLQTPKDELVGPFFKPMQVKAMAHSVRQGRRGLAGSCSLLCGFQGGSTNSYGTLQCCSPLMPAMHRIVALIYFGEEQLSTDASVFLHLQGDRWLSACWKGRVHLRCRSKGLLTPSAPALCVTGISGPSTPAQVWECWQGEVATFP